MESRPRECGEIQSALLSHSGRRKTGGNKTTCSYCTNKLFLSSLMRRSLVSTTTFPCNPSLIVFTSLRNLAGAQSESGGSRQLYTLFIYFSYYTTGSYLWSSASCKFWAQFFLDMLVVSFIHERRTHPTIHNHTDPCVGNEGSLEIILWLIQAPAPFFQNISPLKLLNIFLSWVYRDQMFGGHRPFQLARPKSNLYHNCHLFSFRHLCPNLFNESIVSRSLLFSFNLFPGLGSSLSMLLFFIFLFSSFIAPFTIFPAILYIPAPFSSPFHVRITSLFFYPHQSLTPSLPRPPAL